MLRKIKDKNELNEFFTNDLMENEYGIIIDAAMPPDSYIAIDVDKYYHFVNAYTTPATADILLAAQKLSQKDMFHIYIIEMKNIKSPRNFKVENIYAKFKTVIDDFMKNRYADIFMEQSFHVGRFRLLFITDAYKLKRRGLTEKQIKSFLSETKIAVLQAMPLFKYRNFKAMIEYQLPNPLLEWH
jgi:hypothetical protein